MARTREPHYKADFGLKPYALQQEIIDYIDGKTKNPAGGLYRFFVVVFGRQSGKSWLAKYCLLDHAINRKHKCMWVAPAISSARTHWNDLVRLLEASGLPIKKINQSNKEIQFYGGGSIQVRSAVEPNNIRGDTLDFLVLDEAAFFRNGSYVWEQVCQPMVTASRGTVLFLSTPNGRNWFWELFNLGMSGVSGYYRSWRMSSLESPYQDKELLAEIKKRIPSKRWLEEYMAEFLADAGGVFSGVEEAAHVKRIPVPEPGHSYVCGVDFGFNNDYTCVTLTDKYTRQQVYGERWTDVGTISTVKRIAQLLDIWKPELTVFEKNGLGETFFDLLRQVFSGADIDEGLAGLIYDWEEEVGDFVQSKKELTVGGHRVRGVHMNNAIKRAMVEGLAADIEYNRLETLDKDDEYGLIQVSEMSTYQRKRTAAGLNISYEAQEGSHDDTIAALYLCRSALPKPQRLITPTANQLITIGQAGKKKSPFRSKRSSIRRHRRGK